MRKILGPDAGQLYAMKVLKKASLKGELAFIMRMFLMHVGHMPLRTNPFAINLDHIGSEGQSSHKDGTRYPGGSESSLHCEVALR